MTQAKIGQLDVGQKVYYIPRHKEKKPENAEEGVVTSIRDNHVYVRFKGPGGELTPIEMLYT